MGWLKGNRLFRIIFLGLGFLCSTAPAYSLTLDRALSRCLHILSFFAATEAEQERPKSILENSPGDQLKANTHLTPEEWRDLSLAMGLETALQPERPTEPYVFIIDPKRPHFAYLDFSDRVSALKFLIFFLDLRLRSYGQYVQMEDWILAGKTILASRDRVLTIATRPYGQRLIIDPTGEKTRITFVSQFPDWPKRNENNEILTYAPGSPAFEFSQGISIRAEQPSRP